MAGEGIWLTAAQAKEKGFADEVTGEVKIAAVADLLKFKNIPDNIKNQLTQQAGQTIEVKMSANLEKILEDIKSAISNKSTTPKPKEGKMENCTKCGQSFDPAKLTDGLCVHCMAKAAADDAKKIESKRVSALMASGQKYGLLDEAKQFVDEDKSVDEFNVLVLEKIGNGQALNITVPGAGNPDKPYDSLGAQLVSVAIAGKHGGNVDKRLMHLNNAASGMSEGVDSDGGFVLQQDFTLTLLERAKENAQLAPQCRVIPIGDGANGLRAPFIDETSRATGSRWGGVQVYRKPEGVSPTGKKPKLGSIELRLEKLTGVCYATEELLADTTALGAIIEQAFGEEFAFVLDDEIIRGTGAGQCKGILNSGALVTVAKETGQEATTIVTENLDNMFARMYARGLKNSTWLINQDCWPKLFGLYRGVGTAGIPVFTPPGGIAGAPYGMIHGRPILPIEQCETLGTVGDIIFADLTQYLLIEKGGLTASSSIHVKFVEDEMTFKFTIRNNGQPLWKSALTPYKGSNTVSPFIALASRG
jgi:HK97 family phage major capsid protein